MAGVLHAFLRVSLASQGHPALLLSCELPSPSPLPCMGCTSRSQTLNRGQKPSDCGFSLRLFSRVIRESHGAELWPWSSSMLHLCIHLHLGA